eukprot:jgi/Chlat1/5855/Chrsp4S06370
MASIITQERVLGFLLGSAVCAGSYVYTHKNIWRSAADLADAYSGPNAAPAHASVVKDPPPLFLHKDRAELIRRWNSTVDSVLGSLVSALSRRGL